MLDSVKIARRQSEIRQQLSALVGKPDPSEDETRSMESLDSEYRTNETRYRAALVAEDDERRDAKGELETRGDRQWAGLVAGFDYVQCNAEALPFPDQSFDLVTISFGLRNVTDEDAALRPRSLYAASKVAQEHYALAWTESTGGSVVALRYHNVYGPHMPRDTPYSGVAAIFRSALEAGRAPRVFEDGGQQRDFVHVTDVAQANCRALTAVAPDGALRAYNVASGSPHTVGDMARALADAFGGPAPEVTGEYRIGDVRHVVASPDRARAELGFRARVRFADGMRDFATDPLRPAP